MNTLKAGDVYVPNGNLGRFDMIPHSIRRRRELSPTAKLAFGCLAGFAGKDGRCFPSYASIAESIGVGKRQAIRAIRELVAAGLIATAKRIGEKGQSTNNFVFIWQDWLDADRGDIYDTPPVTYMSPRKEQVENNREEEHDLEHQPAFSAEPSPQPGEGAGCDGSILRAEWHRVHHRHQPAAAPPTDGQIRVLREMASAAAQRPVDDAELCLLIRTTGMPRRRVGDYAWWQRAIANRLVDIHAGYERFKPESAAHSVEREPTSDTFARFLDYEDVQGRVM